MCMCMHVFYVPPYLFAKHELMAIVTGVSNAMYFWISKMVAMSFQRLKVTVLSLEANGFGCNLLSQVFIFNINYFLKFNVLI